MQYCLLIFIVLLCGCSTINPEVIQRRYQGIDFENGIGNEEAKLIAQKGLILSGNQDQYYLEKPLLDDYESNRQNYPDCKFRKKEGDSPSKGTGQGKVSD